MKPGTPLPWKQWPGADHPNAPILIGQPGQHVCAISGTARARVEAEQNAAYIVHAANLYPELVEALEDLVGQWDQGMTCGAIPDSRSHRESVDNARAVLAKAKGE